MAVRNSSDIVNKALFQWWGWDVLVV